MGLPAEKIELVLPKPHEAQQQIIAESARFNVVDCGRRFGKSTLGVDRAIEAALMRRQPVGWLAPTYRMQAEAWRDIEYWLRDVTFKRNVQERRLELYGGGSIEFWSLDKPDVARGRKYGLIVIDEAAMVPRLREVFQAVLRPALTDLRGGAWFLSTPKGFNDFHGLYEFGQDKAHADWASWKMPTSRNPYIDPEEIAAAKALLSPEIFSQEFEAEFIYFAGRVVHNFDRRAQVRDDVKDLGGEILVGMDFNVDPMTACVASKAADELHFWDEVALHNSGTEEMAAELKRRFPKRQITVYPDPTGRRRLSAAPVGQTDLVLLRQAGFTVRAPNASPSVSDRINETNAMCLNASGRRRLFVHPRCKNLIAAFEQLSYKDGTSVIDKMSGHDHWVDGAGYLIHVEFPIRSGAKKAKMVFG